MALDDSPIDSRPIDASVSTVTVVFIPIAELLKKHNMAIRNQTLTVNFLAWDTSANTGKTGDSANFTLRLIKDGGTPAAPTNAVSEPDSTNLPGTYELVLTATEMDADFVTLGGISSTSNIVIIPQHLTTESGEFAAIPAGIWNATQSSYLTAGSTGLYLALAGGILVDTTVTGTPTSTTFQLTAGSAIDDFYNDQLIYIISGTGIGQARPVLDYTGATKTITIDEGWVTTPASGDRVLLLSSHAHPLSQIADAVWDEVLNKAGHNVAQSAGKRIRQLDDAFEVHSGTAQAGAAGTITLDAGASATDDIYRGDRIIIVAGTGAQEHGICTAYNGTTKVATMAENWVITPDATSEFEIVPADVDVETVQHTIQTAGDLAALITTVDTVVDGIQTDLSNSTDGLGALKALIDALDTVVDAIKAKTDSLTFTVAGEVDSNVQSINDVAVTGDGTATPFDMS